jgi:outer membrane protein TolC
MIRRFKVATLGLLLSLPAFAQQDISIDDYLKEVRSKNESVAGAFLSSEGSQGRSKEGQLATATTLFAEAEFSSDAKLQIISIVTYDRIEQHKYSLGIKKAFEFGLETKLYYLMYHTNYVNMGASFPIAPPNFFDIRPTFEFSQQLWANGFGRTTRAKMEQAEAADLANSYKSRYEARSLLNAAEEAFWNLALMRERTEVARLTQEQAKKIHKWNAERVRRNLADEVDELQSAAAEEVADLELQTAIDMERQASRMFNKFRNVVSDEVKMELPELESEALLSRKVMDVKPERDDVKAAEQMQKAALAAGTVSSETYKPTLEAYGLYGANGRSGDLSAGFQNSFQAGRGTFVFGLRFAMPLDRSLANQAMAGVHKEQLATEMQFRQKQNDLLQDWQNLNRSIKELKNRLKLTRSISAAQKTKLDRERQRLTSGRTTTFQILSFEQDYARSRLAEINAKLDLVRALTQLKLYGGNT